MRNRKKSLSQSRFRPSLITDNQQHFLRSAPREAYTRKLSISGIQFNCRRRSRVNRTFSSFFNRRVAFLMVALIAAGLITGRGVFSQASSPNTRRAISLPDDNPQAPFSGAILAGNTLYLSGRIGLDPKTGKAPADADEEIKILLDHVKATLVQAGMSMDDLVYVQIACTDLSLYDKFNAAYRTYFTTKELPAREFIGAATLLRGGHFEIQAIAVRR
jgi:2-iminobutanoate/2-iminopropanoate deaminase